VGPKYRSDKIKREHTVIKEIEELLQEVAKIKGVKSILPGRINQRKGSGHQPYLQLQYITDTGFKLLGKTSSSVQEVFVVTNYPEKVLARMEKKNIIEEK